MGIEYWGDSFTPKEEVLLKELIEEELFIICEDCDFPHISDKGFNYMKQYFEENKKMALLSAFYFARIDAVTEANESVIDKLKKLFISKGDEDEEKSS